MSQYRGGADLERAAKKMLEDNGYYVIRSAGSKGAVDLAALKPGETLLIQCKTDGYVSPGDWVTLRGLAMSVQAVCLVGRWHKATPRAARVVAFDELTSMGPSGHRPWTPDHGLEVSA